jgi:putative ABC transport system permease protein
MMDRTTIRVALRTLGRHKGFTTVAVLSLAIAIALNTTMYSVLDAIYAPQISARRPENLFYLRYFGDYKNHLSPGSVEQALSVQLRGYEGVSGYWSYFGVTRDPLAENGQSARRVRPYTVRPNFFDLLGTPPLQGRTFLPRDESEASAVVISDRLAQQLFPGESPIGRAMRLGGEPYNVVGVVQRNQLFEPLSADLWILRPPGESRQVPLTMIRYREKVDVDVAFAELTVIAAQLALAAGEQPGASRFHLVPYTVRQFKLQRFHWALIGAVVAVLLVACANLANLQLARGLARSRELALRSAVGASRRQLIMHLLLESGIVAIAGLTLGVLLALWGMQLAESSIPPVMAEYIIQPRMSWRVLVFAASAAVLCVVAIGLLPALHVSRVDPDLLLKSSSGTGANRAHRKRYGVMVVAQIAFALPVLVAAIVLVRSAWTFADPLYMLRYGYGYDPAPIISITAPFKSEKNLSFSGVGADLVGRARSARGITDATMFQYAAPVKRLVSVDGKDGAVREVPANSWSYEIVSPSHLRTLGRTIKRGRDFAEGEIDGKSVIIDESTALFVWGRENPVGRAIKFGNAHSDAPWMTVVGVVGDVRDSAAMVSADYMYGRKMGRVYRVVGPRDSVLLSKTGWGFIRLYARASGSTELAALRLTRTLRTVKLAETVAAIPLTDEMRVGRWRTQSSFAASLFTAFGLLGVGLVAIGVYGIVAHSVAERRRELAVRISLGATWRNILHSVLREGNALILTGVALGLLFTKYTILWLGNFMAGENDAYDAVLFAGISAVLFGVAALAAFAPALRATRIDPVEALRHE